MKMKQIIQIFALPLLMTTIITAFFCKKNADIHHRANHASYFSC
jgi:hypothetical protein